MSLKTRVLTLALAALVLMPVVAAAQSSTSIGVKGGVSFAKIDFDDDDNANTEGLLGGVGGVFLSKAISDNMGFRLEGLFSQKGVKGDVEGEQDAKIRLTYIDVPALLTFGSRFNFFAGPQVSFNTKAEIGNDDITVDIKDNIKSTDFGVVVGVGMESGRFTADAKYTHGFTNLNDAGDDKVKNRVVALMVGIKLK